MRVMITGGSGFLGTLLARRLLSGEVGVGGSAPQRVQELLLVDLVAPQPDLLADPRVVPITGELEAQLPTLGTADLVFHLAGVVSGAAEADFDLGMRTNVDGTRALFEWARRLSTPPVLVFSSSLAVFGTNPAGEAVEIVRDDTLPTPQSSYGTQKFIGEQLLADYTRRGFIRGRSVRLMTVSVRPGKPNAAASSFLSGIIREPIAGQRANCPVPPDTAIALCSPSRTIDGLIRAAEVDDVTWGSRTALNLPALTTTPREMVEALERVVGTGTSDLIDWIDDPAVRAIVGSWPARFSTERAESLGLLPPPDFDAIIREYLTTITGSDAGQARVGGPGEQT
ncbi:D-erythronate dehydrogenase [Micromonospora sp. DT48]|uniref:D-erythronate dehydrogenase n=1 Tax=unclassified Micromonospora TaxID=2617518 RepID=UPI0012BD6CFB|nr:D-erythronate dehydrogenase [Micromonospora sp. CP22]MTK03429.1 NAD-dependent epimerase/dehydratase family protein [Micromonospora sp. CP22]